MMKRIAGILSVLLIVIPGLIACSTNTGEAMLEDNVWTLESYGEPGNLKTVMADTVITAEFVSTEDTIKGSAGCNHYFGGYEIKGRRLSIPGPIAVTEMYCMEPEGIMDQEQEYLAILRLAENYEIDDGELHIDCGNQVLIFKRD